MKMDLFFLQPISYEIWESKYQLKNKDGAIIEKTIGETFNRVATVLSEKESNNSYWREKFYNLMSKGGFIGGGRIVSNAGASQYKPNTSLINCTVMNQIPDSMEGIMQILKESAKTLQRGAGVGYDFSTIRPKGALVRGVGAGTSGPISFMEIYDKMCFTIQSAGGRRGAQMGVMDCQHPDIESFITAKREDGKFRQFNLSVLITKRFMDAVIENRDWELWFWTRTSLSKESVPQNELKEIAKGDIPFHHPDYKYFSFAEEHIETVYGNIKPTEIFEKTVYKTVPATHLWDIIMKSAYDYAEPGFILIDEVNEKNNLWWLETIRSTNPCVTSDTWIQTEKGPLKVENLIGKQFTAVVNGKKYLSEKEGFFKTANKKVIELETTNGEKIKLTSDHKIKKVTQITRDRVETEWCEAGNIKIGEYISLNNHREFSSWDGESTYGENEGYLLGLLVGDGTFSENQAVLSVWEEKKAANDNISESYGINPIMSFVENAVSSLKKRADFSGWHKITGRDEYRLSLSAITKIAKEFDIYQGNKTTTDKIEKSSSDFYVGFIKGVFDSDGSVQGNHEKGVSIRLSQSNIDTLEAIQRMLLRLGISSKIYKNRRVETQKLFPNGKGEYSLYNTKAQHELVITGDNIIRYNTLIGFNDSKKQSRLSTHITAFKKSANRERFITKLKSIKELGFEDVYDVQIPGINSFDGNGFVCHNCGEQPLPPHGACLLGSMVLPKYVLNPFSDDAKFDFDSFSEDVKVAARMLDNVVEYHGLPLKEQEFEILNKRRHGMGFTGLANTFTMLKVKYGSQESVDLTERIASTLAISNYEMGIELAKEKGVAPILDKYYKTNKEIENRLSSVFTIDEISNFKNIELIRDDEIKGTVLHAASKYFDLFPKEIRLELALNGSRFTHATTIAPNGTISLLHNNVSNGIEPTFTHVYMRNVIVPGNKTKAQQEVMDYAYLLYKNEIEPNATPENLPDYFVASSTLKPTEHIDIQSAAQKYIDTSISKTINVPTDFPYESFKSIYIEAYKKGLKGVTTFRFNPHFSSGVLVEKNNLKNTTYEFTLDNGKTIQVRGDEKVLYDGEVHIAANLFDALKEGYFGKY
ncbi:ribonucleoside-diphosphate reductase [bacterium]|nr:ribonucleoside-diphosphate reductase [bacterium]